MSKQNCTRAVKVCFIAPKAYPIFNPDIGDYYYVYAPYISGYSYPIEVKNIDAEKTMTKYVNSVEEFKIYNLDFVFSKSRSLNFLKAREFFVNFFESHPKLFTILNYLYNALNGIKS